MANIRILQITSMTKAKNIKERLIADPPEGVEPARLIPANETVVSFDFQALEGTWDSCPRGIVFIREVKK